MLLTCAIECVEGVVGSWDGVALDGVIVSVGAGAMATSPSFWMWAGVPTALGLADADADADADAEAEALAECIGLSMLVSSMVLWLELDPSDIKVFFFEFVIPCLDYEISACPFSWNQ